MLTLDYGGSPDTRSLCPLSLTANPAGWDALIRAGQQVRDLVARPHWPT
jgi:hypothetical protein